MVEAGEPVPPQSCIQRVERGGAIVVKAVAPPCGSFTEFVVVSREAHSSL